MAPGKKQPSKAKSASRPPTTAPAAEEGSAKLAQGLDRPGVRNTPDPAPTATVPRAPDPLPDLYVPRELRIDGWVQPVLVTGIAGQRLLRAKNSQQHAQAATVARAPASASTSAGGKGKAIPGAGFTSRKASSAGASTAVEGKGKGNKVIGKLRPQIDAPLEASGGRLPAGHGMPQPSASQELAAPISSGSGKATKGVGNGKGIGIALPAASPASARKPTRDLAGPRARERKRKAPKDEIEVPFSQPPRDIPERRGEKRQRTGPPAPAKGLAQPRIATSEKGKGRALTPAPTSVTKDLLPPALSTRFGANKRGVMFPVRCEVGESSTSATPALARVPVLSAAAPAVPELPASPRSSRITLGSRTFSRPAPAPSRSLRSRPSASLPATGAVQKPSSSNNSKKGKGKDKGKGKALRSPPPNRTKATSTTAIDAEAELLIEVARSVFGQEFSGREPDGRNLASLLSRSEVGKRTFGGRARDPLSGPYRDPALRRFTAEAAEENDSAGAADELHGEALADWVRAGAENSVDFHHQWTTLAEPDGKGYRLGDNERARGVSPTAGAEEEVDDDEEQSPLRPRSRSGESGRPPNLGRERSESPSPPAMSPWSKGCFDECVQLG